jgi:hypothetical protein
MTKLLQGDGVSPMPPLLPLNLTNYDVVTNNLQSTPCNIPEERKPHQHHRRSPETKCISIIPNPQVGEPNSISLPKRALLTTCSRAISMKFIVAHSFLAFMNPECSLLYSQEAITGPYL